MGERLRNWLHAQFGSAGSRDPGRLPEPARVYIGLVGVAGALVALRATVEWQPEKTGQFLFYLACGVLCSNLKVWLPGVTGTLSVNFLFILAGVVELNWPQTVAIACTSGVAQLFWRARKWPRPVQVWFTFSSMAVCAALAHGVYSYPLSESYTASLPIRLFSATVVYFLSNTIAVGVVISLTKGVQLWKPWKNDLFWTAPHYLAGAAVVAGMHLVTRHLGWQAGVLGLPVVYLVYHSYRLYLGRLEEQGKHVAEMTDLHLRTIEALALAVDAKDGTTHEHLRRVQIYAREIGRELGITEEDRKALEAASLLHDIGKLAVPEHILSKPGRLTPEEFEKMKIHPLVGAQILESVRFPYPVVPIVRAHHEKWNGSGYPLGLKGEEIPMGARILAAVDCLDALASNRQYRRALSMEEALEKVTEESGRSFDPRVVEVLRRRSKDLERKAEAGSGAMRLATDVKVERGCAPDAGLVRTAASTTQNRRDFLTAIASARQEFQMLLELTNDLGSSLRLDDTMALLASRLKSAIPHTGIAIYTIEGDHLKAQYAAGDDAALFSSLRIPLGEGLSGWVARSERPIVNGNPSVEPGYLNDPSKSCGLRSALSAPLTGATGVVGALTLYHREADAFSNDHLRILQAVSAKAGLTIQNALRYVEAEQTAVTDDLTGLPNARSLFLELDGEIARASRNGSTLGVMVIDMDGFKQVNDELGHTEGNRVLQRTARALRASCREYDYAARMGGDEFVAVMPGVTGVAAAERIERLDAAVRAIGREIGAGESLGLSAGVAFFPMDAASAEQLIACADARMYKMKRQHHAQERSARHAPPAKPVVMMERKGTLARLA
jgi:diguanylate cyclase (GGDEF)-like protein/putative nucleotidyltransferase with HDIG domain